MTTEAPRECPRTLSGIHVYSRTVGGRDYCTCGQPRTITTREGARHDHEYPPDRDDVERTTFPFTP